MKNDETSRFAIVIRNISFILLLLLPVAALGTRFGLWHFRLGLLLLAATLIASLLFQIINAIWLIRKPPEGTKTALRWASLFSLPSIVLIALLLRERTDGIAPIHNISTDSDNPPAFVEAIARRGETSNPLPYLPQVAEIQGKAFPDVSPIISDIDVQSAFQKSLAIATELGWDVYAQDSASGRIEAVDTTFWMGFKDDIVIRIKPTDTGSRIDLRSVSRVGVSDLGANANRILQFKALFLEPST